MNAHTMELKAAVPCTEYHGSATMLGYEGCARMRRVRITRGCAAREVSRWRLRTAFLKIDRALTKANKVDILPRRERNQPTPCSFHPLPAATLSVTHMATPSLPILPLFPNEYDEYELPSTHSS
ncbi:hypothetical protein LZ32DRAFT_30982 [Colletotrichum eremochloae]|nr:hypothetical protein LZ32DRAFT_30982 [Colletotrichum eremochloae]